MELDWHELVRELNYEHRAIRETVAPVVGRRSGLGALRPGADELLREPVDDGTLKNGPVWVAGERGGALSFNGTSQFVANRSGLFPDTTDTFTMALWAKPAARRDAVTESNHGISGQTGQRYAIYPEFGDRYYGQNHAGAGISIGTNGVSVFELHSSYFPALLVQRK